MAEQEYPELTLEDAKKMTLSVLREEMKKRGLNSTGTKKKLLNRIRYYKGRGVSPPFC